MLNMTEKLIKLSDRTAEFFICVLIFALPFSKSIVEVSFTAALISWVIKRSIMRDFRPANTAVSLPIVAFTFLGFLSTLTSVSLILSLEGFFFKLLEWVMLYFIIVEVINNTEKFGRILLVILFSMILTAADGLFQFITGADFIRKNPLIPSLIGGGIIQGPFGNPNTFAGWLVIIAPPVLSLAYFGTGNWPGLSKKYEWFKKSVRPLLWAVAILSIVCLALTYSRGGWVAFMLSLIFLGIVRDKKILIFIIIAAFILSFTVPHFLKYRIKSITNFSQLDRFILWKEALDITADFPVLGAGLNTYATVVPAYKLTEETGYYPHNSYLQMAAESGVLGVGAFLWILVALFRTSISNIKRINDKFYGAVLAGLLAGLFGFLVHSFFDVNMYSLQLGNLMWFIMGLIIAVQKVFSTEERLL